MANLFREAKALLDKKDSGAQLSEEELELINTAVIPLMVNTDGIFPDDITIAEGLKELARMIGDEEKTPTQESYPDRKKKTVTSRKHRLVEKAR